MEKSELSRAVCGEILGEMSCFVRVIILLAFCASVSYCDKDALCGGGQSNFTCHACLCSVCACEHVTVPVLIQNFYSVLIKAIVIPTRL